MLAGVSGVSEVLLGPLVPGKEIWMEFTGDGRDGAGRPSAYVYLTDGRMVQAYLVDQRGRNQGGSEADYDRTSAYGDLLRELDLEADDSWMARISPWP